MAKISILQLFEFLNLRFIWNLLFEIWNLKCLGQLNEYIFSYPGIATRSY